MASIGLTKSGFRRADFEPADIHRFQQRDAAIIVGIGTRTQAAIVRHPGAQPAGAGFNPILR